MLYFDITIMSVFFGRSARYVYCIAKLWHRYLYVVKMWNIQVIKWFYWSDQYRNACLNCPGLFIWRLIVQQGYSWHCILIWHPLRPFFRWHIHFVRNRGSWPIVMITRGFHGTLMQSMTFFYSSYPVFGVGSRSTPRGLAELCCR